ncbi:uncharacterized protein, partial [Diabrotica undecimpunctata]|uniref:uncharacterized protein n=1 Tax=Diabrotica undecimpunctata TaxID=50387 RepID=UPI003B63AE5D
MECKRHKATQTRNKIDILLVFETHLTSKTSCGIPNFDVYNVAPPDVDRLDRVRAAVLIRNGIIHYLLNKLEKNDMQATSVVIEDLNIPITITAVYCPPNYQANKKMFTELFRNNGNRFLAGGDYNSKHTSWGSRLTAPGRGRKLYQVIQELHLKSSINTIEEHKSEILDKILEKPPDPTPPVKLVISKKKGSIFKSRTLVDDGVSKKRRALYKHKWTDDNKEPSKEKEEGEGESSSNQEEKVEDFDFKEENLERVVKEVDEEEITSVKCTRNNKGYYTVVRNVKKAHQIQEIGEFQEFNDDVEYIQDALQDNNPISTRCLSAITLASKCMAPAFRMHVRAHGTVAKFFKALHDAPKNQSLGLCTATVMFVLSQDRLNMDLDRDCLELMLNLLESDVSYQQALDECGLSSAQLEKNKQKVRELCAEIQSQGHAMHLNLESITVGQLAMETLLSLTSKRAGEWFKEELRELGGLEHIMKTIHECCRQVSDYVVTWTDTLLDKLKKVDRCLRVLEN